MSGIQADFASDTITRPTDAMRQAMAQAIVGDDVFDEDPTIQALEARIAGLVGKEDAIFVPSGTMSNQIAIRLHCRPGDELICEENSHINNYEQAAHVQLSGVAPKPIRGNMGIIDLDQLQGTIRPVNDHCVRTRLICLENTHNRGAGRVQPFATLQAICAWARENGLARHLDGARLFNAVVATGIPAADWAAPFDTVTICFSKGLGAPVGSALCGTATQVREARRHRKVLGGGMRQAGIIAAGALYALDHHIDRLAEDHLKAQRLADAIRSAPGLELDPDLVETNMVFFRVTGPAAISAPEFCARLLAQGIRMLPENDRRIRAVTHLDVSLDQVDRACQRIQLIATDLQTELADKATVGNV